MVQCTEWASLFSHAGSASPQDRGIWHSSAVFGQLSARVLAACPILSAKRRICRQCAIGQARETNWASCGHGTAAFGVGCSSSSRPSRSCTRFPCSQGLLEQRPHGIWPMAGVGIRKPTRDPKRNKPILRLIGGSANKAQPPKQPKNRNFLFVLVSKNQPEIRGDSPFPASASPGRCPAAVGAVHGSRRGHARGR